MMAKQIYTAYQSRNRLTQMLLGLIIIGLSISASASSQDITFRAEAPKLLNVGEQFQVIYTVNQRVDEFQPPTFDGFQLLGGPMTGSSTSIQMVNGKTTRNATYTYTYYFRAINPGTYNIEPASVVFKKNTYPSNALNIEVVGTPKSSNPGAQTSQPANNSSTPTANASKAAGENHFAVLHLDKKTAYIGEQVTAYLKIYTKLNISNANPQGSIDYSGFYKVDLEDPNMFKLIREKVGDDIYNAVLMQKVLLYPQRSGELTIAPIDINTTIKEQASRPSSVFDEFFGPTYANREIKISTQPVKIIIKPFPTDGQPASFSGAVGSFTINTSISSTDVKTNDAITLKVIINGTGNIKLLEGIKPSFPPTFEAFDPIEKVNINSNDHGRSGSKTIEYTLIPRHAGNFALSPVEFSYFNPATKSYATLQSPSYKILVSKSAADTTSTIITGISQKQVELLGSDIKYIETKLKPKPANQFIFEAQWFKLIYVIVILSVILLAIVLQQRRKKHADIVSLQRSKASKIARKRLKRAYQLQKENNKEAFYEELTKALWGYIADKISIPAANLSTDKARDELRQKGVEQSLIDAFVKITEDCEFARYAPGSVSISLHEQYEQVSNVITKIEQTVKS